MNLIQSYSKKNNKLFLMITLNVEKIELLFIFYENTVISLFKLYDDADIDI